MKRFFTIILTILLCIGAVSGTIALARQLKNEVETEQSTNNSTSNSSNSSLREDTSDSSTKDDSVSDSSNSSSKDDSSDSTSKDDSSNSSSKDDSSTDESIDVTEKDGLIVPENESSLVCDGLEMATGAQLYLGADTTRPSLRFTCKVSANLKAQVESDTNKKLAMLCIPTKFFDRVNPNNYTYLDWISEFNEAGINTYYLTEYEPSQLLESGGKYSMLYRIEDIPYGGIDMDIACLGVLIDNSGSAPTYTYSKIEGGKTYRSNARSAAYMAAATLSYNTLGVITLTNEQLTKVQGYINEAVDKANGLTQATDDGSKFILSVSPTGPKTLKIGEGFEISASYAPNNVKVPIWYRSTDESVVSVDASGKVTARKAGTAVIGVYVAGESFGITVTVTK